LTAQISVASGIAGRYASALFELARSGHALDAVAAELEKIRALLSASPELLRLVRAPIYSREEQSRALGALLATAGIGDLVRRFTGVVTANRRLSALPDMIEAYFALLAMHRGETVAEVATARPLDPGLLKALSQALRQAAGRDVKILPKVEPELIGGLMVKIGSRMLDASVRSKLNRLKLAMKGIG
jgi:F-type H+-transporting ATPase subunit delta